MRRLLPGGLLTAMMLFTSACSGPSHMLRVDAPAKLDIRAVKPDKGKAALVVTRTTTAGVAIEFNTYLDKKMIGVTKGKTFFIKRDVEPGTHYVIAKAESVEAGKITFQKGRTYYIYYTPSLGWLGTRIWMYPHDPSQAVAEMNDGCRLFEYDPKDPGDDLSDEDFKQAVLEYEKNPAAGHHMEYATYRGYEIK